MLKKRLKLLNKQNAALLTFCVTLLSFYGCGKKEHLINKQVAIEAAIDNQAEEATSSALLFEKIDHYCPEAPDNLLSEILHNTFLQSTEITLPINTRIVCLLSKETDNNQLKENEFSAENKKSITTHFLAQSATPRTQLDRYFQHFFAQEGWHYVEQKNEYLSLFNAKKIDKKITLLIRPHDQNAKINNLHFLLKQKTKPCYKN